MSDTIYQAAALIIPLIFAIVFHEVAHGWVARALGDPTASALGRLSLNPLKHVDPVGTILLPGALKLMGLPVFGWAKPVPVVKARLGHPRRDMMLVAAAGPGMNLVMALVGAVLLGLLLRPYAGLQEPAGVAGFIAANLLNFLLLNVFLALFNLLPIPPFDGGHIVEGLLPRAALPVWAQLQRFGLLLVIGLIVVLPYLVPGMNLIGQYVVPPVRWVTEHYLSLATLIAGG
jgi:Zn-dependent protease